jgi:hypothetical protein
MRAVAPNEERAVAQLRQLKKLLDDGILTQQVFHPLAIAFSAQKDLVMVGCRR